MSSELPVPDDIAANPEAIDLMRAWVLKNGLYMSLDFVSVFNSPDGVGEMLGLRGQDL